MTIPLKLAIAVSDSVFFGVTTALNPDGKSSDALMLVTSENPLLTSTMASIESPSPGSTSSFLTGGISCAFEDSEDVSATTEPWAV